MADMERGIAPGLSVVGFGIWSALGPDGPSTIAGIRGQIIGSETGSLWDPTAGANLSCFRVAAHQWWEGPGFIAELATPPIEECLAQVSNLLPKALRRPASEIPILMAVAPKDRPGRPADLEAQVLRDLTRKLGRALPEGSGVVGGGRTGLPHLLATAARQSDRYPLQILVGAESFLRQTIAEHYIAKNRLLCGANTSGFTLGEAGAAILVARTGTTQGPELALTGMGTGVEPGRDGGSREQPTTGEGLTRAIRSALAVTGIPLYDFPGLIGDLNGEHFKFKEQMMAQMRLDRAPPEGRSRRPRGYTEHWSVIEYLGEIGAALMPAQLALAFEYGRTGLLPQNRALCFAGEDDGRRVCVTAEMRGLP
jgi:3-oxoacyl-[acyl-carrier-protein] synthase I